jgi:hypothetical protein
MAEHFPDERGHLQDPPTLQIDEAPLTFASWDESHANASSRSRNLFAGCPVLEHPCNICHTNLEPACDMQIMQETGNPN